MSRRLESALHQANAAVYARSLSAREHSGMGSTVTAAILWRNTAHLAQVGDSRAYLYRSGALWQITEDQSLVRMLVETEQISLEAARSHPGQNMLLQALGPQATVTPAITSLRVCRGDRLLVCSDGLTGPLDDRFLHDVLERAPGPGDAAEELIRLALAAGARDNITAVVAEINSASLPGPTGDPLVLKRTKVYRHGASDEQVESRGSWLHRLLPRRGRGRHGVPRTARDGAQREGTPAAAPVAPAHGHAHI
jgi:PPM family protein phosphatase